MDVDICDQSQYTSLVTGGGGGDKKRVSTILDFIDSIDGTMLVL